MTAPVSWHAANQQYLLASLALLRERLEGRAQTDKRESLEALAARMPVIPAIESIGTIFGLSPFERDIVLMCAGLELDSKFAESLMAAQNGSRNGLPTFSLALSVLDNPHWSALSPSAPLRRWRLIELLSSDNLAMSPLRIDERILHYLAGVACVDERLAGIVQLLPPPDDLMASHRAAASSIAKAIAGSGRDFSPPLVVLAGDDAEAKRAVAAYGCRLGHLNLYAASVSSVPSPAADCDIHVRLWEREAALTGSALLLEWDESEVSDPARDAAIARFVGRIRSPLLMSSFKKHRSVHRPAVALEISRPTAAEQLGIWQTSLGPAAEQLNGRLTAVTKQFNLTAGAIRSASAETLAQFDSAGEPEDIVWDACLRQSRPRLDDLAQRIEPAAAWDDLVLPEPQRATLRDIGLHVRERKRVYDDWGFAAKCSRGLGISALFAGASGTGKTMAAEVLANSLRLDLYRIDLSQVISKYIGETEKNLRRVFDAAEDGGAILLFDEADALFGKRSDVKDSHDRYANIEISYLLQRMESYRGLAILTTNLRAALDTAFLRRIRFIVEFPFPDADQRAEIWRRVFPVQTPVETLDIARLARMNIAGGNIRNIAMNAAFLAAGGGGPVRMSHLMEAARGEYLKLEKPLTECWS